MLSRAAETRGAWKLSIEPDVYINEKKFCLIDNWIGRCQGSFFWKSNRVLLRWHPFVFVCRIFCLASSFQYSVKNNVAMAHLDH